MAELSMPTPEIHWPTVRDDLSVRLADQASDAAYFRGMAEAALRRVAVLESELERTRSVLCEECQERVEESG